MREYPVTGMPNESGAGLCDYVLWAADGKPLAVVEAKATAAEVAKAREESEGLGLFVRSLVGLDRGAVVEAFAAFQAGRAFTGNQLQFLNTIIDHLTQSGTVEPARLYEAPYTNFSAKGVDGVFKGAEVVELIRVLDEIRGRAVA